jgi:hypothetical protein
MPWIDSSNAGKTGPSCPWKSFFNRHQKILPNRYVIYVKKNKHNKKGSMHAKDVAYVHVNEHTAEFFGQMQQSNLDGKALP